MTNTLKVIAFANIMFLTATVQSAGILASCGNVVITDDPARYDGLELFDGFELTNENPVTVKKIHGQRYTKNLNIPGVPKKYAGDIDRFDEAALVVGTTDIQGLISGLKKSNINRPCVTLADFNCDAIKQGREKEIKWLECVVLNSSQFEDTNTSGAQQSQGRLSGASIRPPSVDMRPATSNTGGQAEIHIGSAREMGARKGGSAGSAGAHVSGGSNSGGSGTPKYVSQDATHCVEIIAKDFKGCAWKRCIHNSCDLIKISVQYRGGGTAGGLVDLAPNKNAAAAGIFDDGSVLNYRACSWDPKAGYAPYVDGGCRY